MKAVPKPAVISGAAASETSVFKQAIDAAVTKIDEIDNFVESLQVEKQKLYVVIETLKSLMDGGIL